MSLIVRQVDFALQLLVVVSLLCLAARWTTNREAASFLANAVPTLMIAVLSFLVCNGPTALNVPLTAGVSEAHIVVEDLNSQTTPSTSILFENSSALAWSPSLAEKASNNSILNTILRSRLVATQPTSAPYCNFTFSDPIEPPTVSFAYPSVDWHLGALPTPLEPKANFSLLPFPNTRLPTNIPLQTTHTLFRVSLSRLYRLLGGLWSYQTFCEFLRRNRDPVYKKWTGNSAAEREDTVTSMRDIMSFAGDNSVEASSEILDHLFADSSSVIKEEVEADFQYFEVAKSIGFSALTIRIRAMLTFL
ncbi:hypothetical protein ON010_g15120 [Phytophthora cinnamomi]|nr:hypothetical protein ON010_g15120 [Phytophthora cinnamomi]